MKITIEDVRRAMLHLEADNRNITIRNVQDKLFKAIGKRGNAGDISQLIKDVQEEGNTVDWHMRLIRLESKLVGIESIIDEIRRSRVG